MTPKQNIAFVYENLEFKLELKVLIKIIDCFKMAYARF